MTIKFHKTVTRQRLNDGTKQIVQTGKPRLACVAVEGDDIVVHVDYLEIQLAKARAFLQARGINMVKGVYGAPV